MKGALAVWMVGACALTGAGAAAAPPTQVTFDDTGVFPESLTSTSAGDLIIGSSAKGAIYRAPAGASKAGVFIDPKASGMSGVLGVFADDARQTLYACSVAFGAPPEKAASLSALRAFDLRSGAAKAAYPMPDGAKSLCNDIAVARDGTAYVSETLGGRVLRLKAGASALEVWIKDERLASVDGIAVGGDGAVYVNSVGASQMFRIAVNGDGSAGAITELQPSVQLGRPDGLRAIGGNRFLQAENGVGRVSEVVVEGDKATVTPLKTDDPGVTAVTLAKGRVWYVNAKFAYRNDPALKDKSPEPFTADSVEAPPR
jgi:sugar lactone lactonase YvrE